MVKFSLLPRVRRTRVYLLGDLEGLSLPKEVEQLTDLLQSKPVC